MMPKLDHVMAADFEACDNDKHIYNEDTKC